jgi:hypothetical protein
MRKQKPRKGEVFFWKFTVCVGVRLEAVSRCWFTHNLKVQIGNVRAHKGGGRPWDQIEGPLILFLAPSLVHSSHCTTLSPVASPILCRQGCAKFSLWTRLGLPPVFQSQQAKKNVYTFKQQGKSKEDTTSQEVSTTLWREEYEKSMRTWHKHSPQLQKVVSTALSNILQVRVGTAPSAEGGEGKMQHSCFS